jgi:hypothetical protein
MPYIKQRRSLLSTPRWQAIFTALALVLIFGIVGHFDAEDAEQQDDTYCEMVALYKADKAAGVPEHDRRGWPEFKKGEVSCPM